MDKYWFRDLIESELARKEEFAQRANSKKEYCNKIPVICHQNLQLHCHPKDNAAGQ